MTEVLKVEIAGKDVLLGDRFIRLDDDVIIADLHLGKTMHFRKAGLPLPTSARQKDQANVLRLLGEQRPQRLIILGDLFHSETNSEVQELSMITSQFSETDFLLVRGNHDVLDDAEYRSLDFDVVDEYALGPFHLTHEPLDLPKEGLINMHGHIHPGIALSGRGRQRIKIPCFHLTGTHLCLPAFGALTGLMPIRPKKDHRVFGIVEGRVHPFSSTVN